MTGTDPGFTFKIRLKIKSPPTQSVGPNPVLVKKPPMPLPRPTLPRPTLPRPTLPRPTLVGPAIPTEVYTPSSDLKPTSSTTPPDTENRLFSLVQGAFLVLNRTNPNITQSCWLCYASNPPYYGCRPRSAKAVHHQTRRIFDLVIRGSATEQEGAKIGRAHV